MSFFHRYENKESSLFGLAAFLVNGDGVDWYDYQETFSSNKLKVQVNKTGEVVAASRDASKLFPENCIVIEIEEAPEDITSRPYKFDGEMLYVDSEQEIRSKASGLSKEADNVIRLLSDERDAGIISDDDLTRWEAWVKYRKALRELDVTATDIKWPAKPE